MDEPLELAEIEGVQRVPELQHDVVRGVHHVVDRARAGASQAFL